MFRLWKVHLAYMTQGHMACGLSRIAAFFHNFNLKQHVVIHASSVLLDFLFLYVSLILLFQMHYNSVLFFSRPVAYRLSSRRFIVMI